MVSTWKFLVGVWRIVFGHCPACNDDAPACDTCEACKEARSVEYYEPRFNWQNRTEFDKAEITLRWLSKKT